MRSRMHPQVVDEEADKEANELVKEVNKMGRIPGGRMMECVQHTNATEQVHPLFVSTIAAAPTARVHLGHNLHAACVCSWLDALLGRPVIL